MRDLDYPLPPLVTLRDGVAPPDCASLPAVSLRDPVSPSAAKSALLIVEYVRPTDYRAALAHLRAAITQAGFAAD